MVSCWSRSPVHHSTFTPTRTADYDHRWRAVGERHVWWNFVSSSRERIEKAKDDWREGRFGKVPGDDEFIPLPDR